MEGGDVQQPMQQAGVADVHLRAFHLALARIGVPRLQAAHHECRFQRIQIAAHRMMRNTEGAAEFAAVPDLPVVVGQHGPEAVQRRGRHVDVQLRDVALQKRAHEVHPPTIALGVAAHGVRARKSTAQPQPPQLARHLVDGKARKLVVGDAPGQGFRALSQQLWRGAAKHQEARSATAAIGQHAQRWKEVRLALNLVQDDQAAQRRQRQQRIRQHCAVRRGLQIEEVGGARTAARNLPCQRRLAHLPSAYQAHDRIVADQPIDDAAVFVTLDHAEHVTTKIGRGSSNFRG